VQSLYTEVEFKVAKSRQLLPLKCLHCSKIFHKTKHRIMQASTVPNTTWDFCSRYCKDHHQVTSVAVYCQQCGVMFIKQLSKTQRTRHHFCCQSCAAKYNNAHKTKGTRVSKLEIWLSKKLPELYPSLEFHFNRKDAINGELDIYIPSLKLAFELNGIFHYEPIYGLEKLGKMQTNDHRKMLACAEHGIELCVIDVSSQKYFKEQGAIEFLRLIQNIINSKMAR